MIRKYPIRYSLTFILIPALVIGGIYRRSRRTRTQYRPASPWPIWIWAITITDCCVKYAGLATARLHERQPELAA